MSRVHYWSDLHLGHEYVAKLRGFSPAQHMDAWEVHDHHLKTAWLNHVQPKDHIWILGDISGGRNADYALSVIDSLPGIKHLISGNHDSVSSIHRDGWKHQQKFLKVFASVQDFARHKVAGSNFLLSHYPYEGDHAEREVRYNEYRLKDAGMPLLHGHVHDEWNQKTSTQGTPMMNVGFDHWLERPANTEDIIQWLQPKG